MKGARLPVVAGYATAEALEGLFWAVGEEEAHIHRDPVARVLGILETVFGWLDNNRSQSAGAAVSL